MTINWKQVKPVTNIKATDWEIKLDSRSKKLALELWEWPGGTILELSSKVATEEGPAEYEELRTLAIGKGLKSSADQRSKTTKDGTCVKFCVSDTLICSLNWSGL